MMKNYLLAFGLFALMALFTVEAQAQVETPAPSPSSKLIQDVGLTEITIAYSRPSVKNRSIFAPDGLVPYGKVWRFGANAATKFSFSKDVTVSGSKLEAGDYAVLCLPNQEEWTLRFFPYESTDWRSYTKEGVEAAASVKVTPKTSKKPTETMSFTIEDIERTKAIIVFSWANTVVKFPVMVDTDNQVQASIDRVMNGPSKQDYYAAAVYYHDAGKNLQQAREWIEKATEGDKKRFWQVRRQALIYADLGMKSKAMDAAKLSMKLAEEAGNEEYVRMNQKSLQEWTKSK